MIGWGICIATLDRPDVLRRTIAHALSQTVPPAQIVIVDASDGWQASRDAIAAMLQSRPAIRLDYVHSEIRSSTTQRNTGIALCDTEVIFIIDDDSFMYPDCAEAVLALYEADPDGRLAGVRTALVETAPAPPPEATAEAEAATGDLPAAAPLRRKASGNRGRLQVLQRLVLGSRAGRWFHRKVLMQNMQETFLRYDGPRQSPLPEALAARGAGSVSFMPGCAMSVRRDIALAEPFDPALRYYAAYEDVDVSYRYARHGHLVHAPAARLHHFEAASGRIRRKKVIVFQLLNMVVYLRRHAERPEDWRRAYRVMLYRRLLGESLKDLLSGRWNFPQMRGVLIARRHWRRVWECPIARLDDWYPALQKRILDGL
ncbi:MAG: glycosyltransferase family 2 protein [Paracoccus sp. (in: a-proteobacteria)]|uniref:glycosyltransferase family 2 protein n=1 Tax=Paracoccus sp. TaxID=267 RepID=UPI000C6062AD|nr:glycosyltransferase [Paracoccus sp. (in: a-proteobacteria)]MAN58054.1 glycosyl transferase [Paracoccus sp. (in: a-proteobacteria)]MBA47546.1 glycosyl transferase [Paracoccus sp. (in: a-proteobacteria)]MBA50444.1 glycosyl transferase [Paracoccus sp. (in: a-proteobacteria)]